MNEIKRRIEHARMMRRLLEIYGINTHTDWCMSVGLWEIAGWINEDGYGMLKWVKPGYGNT